MDIEDTGKGWVVIDGRKITGHIGPGQCPSCSGPRIYHDDYDAYFCASCNAWLEKRCSDIKCNYCSDRPEWPLGSKGDLIIRDTQPASG